VQNKAIQYKTLLSFCVWIRERTVKQHGSITHSMHSATPPVLSKQRPTAACDLRRVIVRLSRTASQSTSRPIGLTQDRLHHAAVPPYRGNLAPWGTLSDQWTRWTAGQTTRWLYSMTNSNRVGAVSSTVANFRCPLFVLTRNKNSSCSRICPSLAE